MFSGDDDDSDVEIVPRPSSSAPAVKKGRKGSSSSRGSSVGRESHNGERERRERQGRERRRLVG